MPMKFLKTSDVSLSEIRRHISRPALDEVQISEKQAERTARLFGGPLTPAEAVRRIVTEVRRAGDAAALRYARLIDGAELTPETMFVGEEDWLAADKVEAQVWADLELAADNLRRYHEAQKQNSWMTCGPGGSILGQKITPLDRVGLYVPGGTAPLVSSLLMSVIPAQVAGVEEIIVTTPVGATGEVNPLILAAARVCGVDRVLKLGGAQAVAALAYGTETVPAVDKIAGPGNIYVTLAKKMVFGDVGIDMLAGPSEICVIADETARPDWVAVDLLSQAEHDPQAAAILITPSSELAERVQGELTACLQSLPRREIAHSALESWGIVVVCQDLEEACEVANACAPEHLELQVEDPFALLPLIKHAGAIFVGRLATEPLGDYVAGPNHILPTNRTARFSSPLGVTDFVKRSSIVYYTPAALRRDAPVAERIAILEGLDAHARSVTVREDEWRNG